MVDYRIILVEPKTEGNVGSVARAMKNFGITQLTIVNGPALGNKAEAMAIHAQDVLEKARRVGTLQEALDDVDYVVGTTARIPDPSNTYLRVPVDPRDLPPRLAHVSGRVGILFGREDFGLFNEELEECDLLVSIPTSELYRSLNLSHAVSIVGYEIFLQTAQRKNQHLPPMNADMRRHFQATMDALIGAMQMPEHQERNTKTAYRKVFGRAAPTAWEYYVLMGVFRRCLEQFGINYPQGGKLPPFDIPKDLDEEGMRLLEGARD